MPLSGLGKVLKIERNSDPKRLKGHYCVRARANMLAAHPKVEHARACSCISMHAPIWFVIILPRIPSEMPWEDWTIVIFPGSARIKQAGR